MKKSGQTKPPKTLSAEARSLWRELVAEYGIDDAGGLAILRSALEAFDAMRTAEATVAKDGTTTVDRFGQVKGHPLLPVIRDSRAQWLAALKQLNLDVIPARSTIGRPAGS